MQIRRISVRIELERALQELMRIYDRMGGPTAGIDPELDAAIERCLIARGTARDQVHARLQLLMRARDLHHFVLEDEDLVPLKVRLFECLLQHREPAPRWATIRELLLENLDTICRKSLPGSWATLERCKEELSDRSSRIGKLLVTVALFNLDLIDETPPSNLVLHFQRQAFPRHCWEVYAPEGRATHLGRMEPWSPRSPWGRWEYLAADLFHGLCRRHSQTTSPSAAPDADGLRNPASHPADTIYYRIIRPGTDSATAQLTLFPAEPDAMRTELMRRIQSQQGPEGVKLLAVLLAHLNAHQAGAPLTLSLPELAAAAGLGDASQRGMRKRVHKLTRIIEALESIELTRVSNGHAQSHARTTRLLTVLGQSAIRPAAADRNGRKTGTGGADGEDRPAEDCVPTSVRVLPDPFFTTGPGVEADAALGAPLRDLPALLLECAGKDHPCILPLYVWLRRTWSADAPVVERTARTLLDEAGIWVSETGRYRAVENLKRDLDWMREQGWLGAWRVLRAEVRDALEDRYRLSAPLTAAPAGVQVDTARMPKAPDWGAVPDKESARDALMGV